MYSSSLIFTALPALATAVLPNNVTYPRHVLSGSRFTYPSSSTTGKATVWSDTKKGTITGPLPICTQPVITVTTTVTDICPNLADSKQPLHNGSTHSNGKFRTTRSSKSATVTWWDSSTTITGVAPWPVVTTTITKPKSTKTVEQTITYTDWAASYSAGTATVKLNTTTVSGIFVRPVWSTETHVGGEVRTSTVVDFLTRTKVHAHTAVPAPSEAADDISDNDSLDDNSSDDDSDDDSSDDDTCPSGIQLPEHPSIPAPISIVDGSLTFHAASNTKGTPHHPSATNEILDPVFDKVTPQDEDDGRDYYTPEGEGEDGEPLPIWYNDQKDKSDYESPIYDGDDEDETKVFDENEQLDEDKEFGDGLEYAVEDMASLKPQGDKQVLATTTSKRPPKLQDTKTTKHRKRTSSPTQRPISSVKPSTSHRPTRTYATKPRGTSSMNHSADIHSTLVAHHDTENPFTALTLYGPTISVLSAEGKWNTNTTNATDSTKDAEPFVPLATVSNIIPDMGLVHPMVPLNVPIEAASKLNKGASPAAGTPSIAAGRTKSSQTQTASSISRSLPEALVTEIPVPTPPYSKTYVAQFSLSRLTLSYKPVHHGHISMTSSSKPSKTDDMLSSPSPAVTMHPLMSGGPGGKLSKVRGDRSKLAPTQLRSSVDDENEFCHSHSQGSEGTVDRLAMCREWVHDEEPEQ